MDTERPPKSHNRQGRIIALAILGTLLLLLVLARVGVWLVS